MDYSKLRGKVREKFGSESSFAEAMGLSRATLSARFNDKSDWSCAEVVKACELLDVDLNNAHEYFFCHKS